MDKQRLRELVWQRLEQAGVVTFPKPARGRIPNFTGSELAARRLRGLRAWARAEVVMVNPDAAQRAVRELALEDGKLLLMATPKLRAGFVALDPTHIPSPPKASTIQGALKYGRPTNVRGLKVDLIVEGSVAVDREGNRLGKGGGFGDLEVAILKEAGAASDETPIATTVHELQLIERVPRAKHDAPVDLIVTPERVLEVKPRRPKPGLLWELLSPEQLELMPILAELREALDRGG